MFDKSQLTLTEPPAVLSAAVILIVLVLGAVVTQGENGLVLVLLVICQVWLLIICHVKAQLVARLVKLLNLIVRRHLLDWSAMELRSALFAHQLGARHFDPAFPRTGRLSHTCTFPGFAREVQHKG